MPNEINFDNEQPGGGASSSGSFASPPGAMQCEACGAAITDHYFTFGEQVMCSACSRGTIELVQQGPGLVGFGRALLFGGVAAIAGAMVWGTIVYVTGYQIALVSIAVGIGIGMAIKVGTYNLGGRLYQLMAVTFTYLAIVTSYVPLLVSEWDAAMRSGQDTFQTEAADPNSAEAFWGVGEAAVDTGSHWRAEHGLPPQWIQGAYSGPDPDDPAVRFFLYTVAFFLSLFAPLLGVVLDFPGGLISLLIIGFALFEAGRLTSPNREAVQGPFAVGTMPPPPPQAAAT